MAKVAGSGTFTSGLGAVSLKGAVTVDPSILGNSERLREGGQLERRRFRSTSRLARDGRSIVLLLFGSIQAGVTSTSPYLSSKLCRECNSPGSPSRLVLQDQASHATAVVS